MSALTTTILLALASTAAAKGGKVKGGGGSGFSNVDSNWLVPISTAITALTLLVYFWQYVRIRKTAPMFYCIIIIFVAQVINFFTGLSTALESFGEKLPATWGIADAFAQFFLMGGNILVFVTVQKAIWNEKAPGFPSAAKIAIWVWTAAMWFGAGYVWGMVVRYSLAWKKIHNFLVKNNDKANNDVLDREYSELWNNYMWWNTRMRNSIIGVNGAYLFFCIALVVLTLVKRKALTKKEKIFFPCLVLGGRLISLLSQVALQASFLWKGGEWSNKGFTIAVWVIVAFCWILTIGGYSSILKSYKAIIDPTSVKSSGKDVDDEEAHESLTGNSSSGAVYPQGSNAVVGGEYGYAKMPASQNDSPYPTYAPTDTRYSRTSYEAPEPTKEGKKGKKEKKAVKAELVGKAILDRIGDVIPVKH